MYPKSTLRREGARDDPSVPERGAGRSPRIRRARRATFPTAGALAREIATRGGVRVRKLHRCGRLRSIRARSVTPELPPRHAHNTYNAKVLVPSNSTGTSNNITNSNNNGDSNSSTKLRPPGRRPARARGFSSACAAKTRAPHRRGPTGPPERQTPRARAARHNDAVRLNKSSLFCVKLC